MVKLRHKGSKVGHRAGQGEALFSPVAIPRLRWKNLNNCGKKKNPADGGGK